MNEQTLLTILLVVGCIVAALLVLKLVKKVIGKVILVALIAVLLFGGKEVIDLNTLSASVQTKVQEVVEVAGDSYIKTEGNKVFLKLNDEWLDISKVSAVGNAATKDFTLEYDGRTIEVGHSGIVNTIKALEAVGLLGDKD